MKNKILLLSILLLISGCTFNNKKVVSENKTEENKTINETNVVSKEESNLLDIINDALNNYVNGKNLKEGNFTYTIEELEKMGVDTSPIKSLCKDKCNYKVNYSFNTETNTTSLNIQSSDEKDVVEGNITESDSKYLILTILSEIGNNIYKNDELKKFELKDGQYVISLTDIKNKTNYDLSKLGSCNFDKTLIYIEKPNETTNSTISMMFDLSCE